MGKRKKRNEKGNKRGESAVEILKKQKGYYLINPAYPEEIIFSVIGLGEAKSQAAIKGRAEDFPDGKVLFRYIECERES